MQKAIHRGMTVEILDISDYQSVISIVRTIDRFTELKNS